MGLTSFLVPSFPSLLIRIHSLVTPVDHPPSPSPLTQNGEQLAEEYRASLPQPAESDAATLAATQSIALDPNPDILMTPAREANADPPEVTPTATATSTIRILSPKKEASVRILPAASSASSPSSPGIKILEAHGIKMMPVETGGGALEKRMRSSGQALALTEAGKMLLNNDKPKAGNVQVVVSQPQTAATKRIVTSAAAAGTQVIRLSKPNSGVVSSGQGLKVQLARPAMPSKPTIVKAAAGAASGPTPKVIKVTKEQFAAIKASEDKRGERKKYYSFFGRV